MSSALLTAMAVGAGAFTLALGIVHFGIPRLVGYRAALGLGSEGSPQAGALPPPAQFGRGAGAYRVTPHDLLGIAWVMSNAASFVLISIGLVELAWAAGWRDVPVALGSAWIAAWWAIRAVGQLALGRRPGDLLALAAFGVLSAAHLLLAVASV